MSGQGLATALGLSGAVGKENYGILALLHRIKNSNVQILVAVLVMQNDVRDFCHRQWTGFEFVSVRCFAVCFFRKRALRFGLRFRNR